MKALVCKEFGPAKNLKVEEMNEPIPNADEVCIKVHAAGVNFPDILMVEGKYQVKPAFPFAPGAEAAGEIISIGENITKYKIGQRVIAMTGHGAFAEIVKASEKKLIPLNDNVDFETASILPMVYGTSAHALIQRGKLKKGMDE